MNQLISAENVSKSFGSGHTQITAVRDLNLKVSASELVMIMGPSGSGKTTLLSMLGTLLQPSQGIIQIDGQRIDGLAETHLSTIRGQKIGFIFQAFNLLEALTVEENIIFPSRLVSISEHTAKKRAHDLMERLKLVPRRHALPSTLSGGEKQRTAIARALINNPPIILADEPTGNLDSQSGQEVMMVLHDIAKDEGRAVIMVTHDPRVEDIANRVLWLEDGILTSRQERHSWSHCPICNMRVDEWTAQYELMRNNKRVVFCSQACKDKYDLG